MSLNVVIGKTLIGLGTFLLIRYFAFNILKLRKKIAEDKLKDMEEDDEWAE